MNGSGYRRLSVIVLSLLLSLILATSALAAKPDFFTIPLDVTETLDCGGFIIEEHVEGTIRISTHFDKDGDFAMEIARFKLQHTFVNPETGASLSSPDVGINRVTVSQDGSFTLAEIGLVYRLVVPGEGLIFAVIGRAVFNLDTGEVLFEAGQHDEDLLGPLCAALG
ncbi:MAG TPA: hypothetical protein VK900_11155 [Anaerolineales bacterium]|nr:hypothetical protein [Anaerolineales bacterium]